MEIVSDGAHTIRLLLKEFDQAKNSNYCLILALCMPSLWILKSWSSQWQGKPKYEPFSPNQVVNFKIVTVLS